MLRPYERSGLIVAAGLSIVVHASAVVYLMQHDMHLSREQPAPAGVTHISMTLAKPRPAPAAPVAGPPPRRVSRPEPDAQKPVPVPRAVAAPKRAPPPVPVPPPVPAMTAIPQLVPAADVSTAAAAESHAIVQPPLPGESENVQENYLQQLLAHIDSHKYYPRSARRRGQEGEIEVSFYLLADGGIRALQVSGGSRVLRQAAERAVQASLPMPVPPAELELKEQISFGMVFRLG